MLLDDSMFYVNSFMLGHESFNSKVIQTGVNGICQRQTGSKALYIHMHSTKDMNANYSLLGAIYNMGVNILP